MKKILGTIMLSVLLLATAACSTDKDNYVDPVIPSDALFDIVTLASTNDKSSTFTAQKNENSPEVTYFSTVSFIGNKNVKPGMRILIAYSMQNGAAAYTTGNINLYGYSLLSNTEPDVLIGTAEQYGGWNSEPIKLSSMTLTGNYLNVYAQMFTNSTAAPTKYILVADETTLDKPVIETHLILKSNLPDGGNLANLYASYNIKQLFEKETCQKVKVNYFDVSGTGYKEFESPTISVRPID